MTDDLCFFAKDSLIIKAPKKNPLLLRMAVLMFVMVCGVYICSVCLRQIGGRSLEHLSSVEVVERPCELTNVEPLEKPFLHFPKPKSFSRAECACNPVRYFAILSTQRSGSGWFETLLNSHVNISSNGEIFSVKVRRSNITTIVDTLDKIYNLDWFTSASKNECTAAVGLKWMLNQALSQLRQYYILRMTSLFYGLPSQPDQAAQFKQFDARVLPWMSPIPGLMQHHEEIVNYFNAKGVSAIFLFRRNLLHRMISVLANSYDQNAKLLNGTHKSHVHSHEEAEILAKYKPTVDTTTLIPNLKQLEDLVTKSLEYFKNTRHIILYYEDILKKRKKLADVQDFLRVPRMELRSRQVKIHKGSLSSQVENWEDVKKTLQGTSYEKFLDQYYKL